MIATAEVRTWEPRVRLPGPEYVPVPEVAAALNNYARLFQGRVDAQAASDRAERAVLDNETAHSQALAEALVNNTTEPRRNVRSTEDAAAAAVARHEAFKVAVGTAHGQLRAAVVEHADAWAAQVAAVHLAAQARYEAAVTEAQAASRDLVATGGLLAMLNTAPASLVVGSYFPAAYLGTANAALEEAADKVREYAPVVPEPEPDAETVEVG